MRLNNVDLETLEKSVEEWKSAPAKAKRVTRVEGVWNVNEDGPQFESRLKYEGGELKLEADQPKGLGGLGRAPGPLNYCLYGLASCYAATFASMAAINGIRLKRLSVAAEGHLNFARSFGLSNDTIMEQVRLTLTVDTEADQERVMQIEEQARDRCPAMYVLGHTIPCHTEVKFEGTR